MKCSRAIFFASIYILSYIAAGNSTPVSVCQISAIKVTKIVV